MQIVAVAFDDPILTELLGERHRDLSVRYAEIRDHPADPTDPSEFAPPSGASMMALVEDVPAACGALRALEDGVAEIKRMYVGERFRRRGLATAILRSLEEEARGLGYGIVRLETGTLQPEAIAFYEANGYHRIECYRQWSGTALSVCYEKSIGAAPSDER